MRSCVAFSSLLALSFSFGVVSADSSHAQLSKRHHTGRSRLDDRETREIHTFQFEKRFDNARFTYYADGLGACGNYNQPGDFIVALNAPQYDGGSHCGEQVTITANGKTTTATIADECMGCPYGALDFSEGLFKYFASEDAGEIYGSWQFGSGDPKPSPSPSPSPTTSSWSSTSTWSPPPSTTSTSTTWTPTSTSSTWSSTSSSSSSVASSSSSATPSSTSSAAETFPTASESDPENLEQFNIALVNLGGLIMAAAMATS
ncbi:hypothetical protein GLOTRDRAFT_137140 [Gloeophyllum trabeum ATCC 11539]|uniref:RlpA-like protein double-psi beta-barrel domain-containing protein n=1 Tax=Gloeophyllum trabeum (strain ATCC 11539 / FP-39264 / Madison 617) TaxID=670483 RepID=S7RUL2_GLOTA|nr:uncharacterized protein GLOTRDRAFT_137140 [Gloeophyllum trabeum ATCC 11539]EPQ58420.1 hypothetical protein GLOTRDRAFT_137140 [Gloeophyllum trabeum ATCC 11539]